ncbi:flavohemoglobin expression-modulating QEGLA motif protein [Phyllobacterium sp. K27]
MSRPRGKSVTEAVIIEALGLIKSGKPVRLEFENDGRLHIDRPLPFLCVYVRNERKNSAALDVASANASYLIAPDIHDAMAVIDAIGAEMIEQFGTFLVIDVGELERDKLLSEDAPYLPPFEITLSATSEPETDAARDSFEEAVNGVVAKFRSPRVSKYSYVDDELAHLANSASAYSCLTVRFAPIYRVPESDDIYPDLRERVVANIFDAGLQAISGFLKFRNAFDYPTHRALGRRVFVEAVERADRSVDEIAASFDFLLAVTPINAKAAWFDFKESKFQRVPRWLYRPLTVQVDAEKKKLFSIPFDRFEDPVLSALYREKQQELDLQLSVLSARETRRFVELGRALYGPVEPELMGAAKEILAHTTRSELGHEVDEIDCHEVERAAQAMIKVYQAEFPGFEATIELRDDVPAGLMVSGARLLVSRSTKMTRSRLYALLSHEIGVHLLTYFNGSAQGLKLFRSGLAGYEGLQEGIAVFAEYLVGGMTPERMRLIGARVVACAAMLDGASFVETFNILVQEYGFRETVPFNLTLRLYRGGGLAKDAIYLRGLLEVLSHLKRGGSLEPFWMGKIAAVHFGVMQELNTRGLLRAAAVKPAFLLHPDAQKRLDKARSGLSPIELVAI